MRSLILNSMAHKGHTLSSRTRVTMWGHWYNIPKMTVWHLRGQETEWDTKSTPGLLNPVLPCMSCVALDKLLNCSWPECLHLIIIGNSAWHFACISQCRTLRFSFQQGRLLLSYQLPVSLTGKIASHFPGNHFVLGRILQRPSGYVNVGWEEPHCSGGKAQ